MLVNSSVLELPFCLLHFLSCSCSVCNMLFPCVIFLHYGIQMVVTHLHSRKFGVLYLYFLERDCLPAKVGPVSAPS